jgi:CRISPR-associated protein Csb3
LDWWQAGDENDDLPIVKTWAGRQEIHKVARSTQDALRLVTHFPSLFAYNCILQMPVEYSKDQGAKSKGIAPFCFDARKFAHTLDVGFSLDVQQIKSQTYPAVELLALIGLQRFHPPSLKKWHFRYTTWLHPLPTPVAVANACGMASSPKSCEHEFRLLFRDDQRRYKALSYAQPIGD